MKTLLKNKYCSLFLIALTFGCEQHNHPSEWTNLLDNDLSHWDKYLSYRLPDDYNGTQPKDENGVLIVPLGINNDPSEVFKVIMENEEPVLHVSGEYYGCVFTKSEFENYHLKLQIKWGDRKWVPRKNKLKDSGVLYHSIGPPGVEYWRSWMLSQEFQVMEGHMGDFWSQATSAIDVRAIRPEGSMNPIADVRWDFLPIGNGEDINGYCLRSNNYESLPGEWTTLELICFKGKSVHVVNGEVVMVLKNSRYVEDGVVYPLVKGKIQLQSEAAELFYKDIRIKELEILPERYNAYFTDSGAK